MPERGFVQRILFVVIVLTTISPAMFLIATQDRRERLETLSRRSDPDLGLAAFLAGVRERTPPGASILLVLPVRNWERYTQGYFRASYILAGREVLPILDQQSRVVAGNVSRADYVASWRTRFSKGGPVVWQGSGGILIRQAEEPEVRQP